MPLLPTGADAVVIQENTTLERDERFARVTVHEGTPDRGNVRLTGFDFRIPNVNGLEVKVEGGYFFPYFFAGGGLTYRI